MAGLSGQDVTAVSVKWRRARPGATAVPDNLPGRGNASSIMPDNAPSIMAREGCAATSD